MHRYGSSTGNGAGCPTLRARSASNLQTLLVNARNSSLVIVLFFPWPSLANRDLEKTRMYSCVSLRVGLVAESQLPHAVEGLLLESLAHITSPLIRKPSFVMCSIMKAWSGMYGLLPRLATLMQHLPPGTRTLLTSSQTLSRKPRYSWRVRFLSYSFPTL